jgi:hypothetical protein
MLIHFGYNHTVNIWMVADMMVGMDGLMFLRCMTVYFNPCKLTKIENIKCLKLVLLSLGTISCNRKSKNNLR